MPGPHGFAVRFSAARLRAGASLTRFSSPCNCHWRARRYRVHRISHPTSVTIAIRPSCGHETAETSGVDMPDETSEIFFSPGLDKKSAKLPVGQIRTEILLSEKPFTRMRFPGGQRVSVGVIRQLCGLEEGIDDREAA